MADRDDCCGQLTVSLVGLHGRLPVVQEVPVSVACLFALYCHVVQDIGWFLLPLPPPPTWSDWLTLADTGTATGLRPHPAPLLCLVLLWHTPEVA